jgi:hypothetical protein
MRDESLPIRREIGFEGGNDGRQYAAYNWVMVSPEK